MSSIINASTAVRPGPGGLLLPLATATVRAGFPSPAADFGETRIDLVAELIAHPQATYLLRVRGLSMVDAGLGDNDIIVVAVVDGDFTVKYLQMRAGRIKLKAANPTFPDIVPKDGQTVEVWGVVTACVKQFLRLR